MFTYVQHEIFRHRSSIIDPRIALSWHWSLTLTAVQILPEVWT